MSRNGRDFRPSSEPPWATDYSSNSTTNYTNNTNNRNNSGNFGGSRSSYNPPWGTNFISGFGGAVRAHAAGSHVGNADGNSGASVDYRNLYRGNGGGSTAVRSETRYGSHSDPRPHDRDIEYWNNLHPYHAPSGTDSHRDRERRRREERINENRRTRVEADALRNVTEDVPLRKNILTVKDVNLHIPENTKEHRTRDYDCTERGTNQRLVVRRGQVFILTLTFQRPWSSKDDDLFLQLSVGEQPSERTGSLVSFQLSENDSSRYKEQHHWGAKIAKEEGEKLTMYVYVAPNAIVGEWKCEVSTASAGSPEVFTYVGIGDIYVLFNPWCKDDQVYYTENIKDLNEYVLNEYGCVFDGHADYISRKPWFYGQFQGGILDICMTLLRMAFDMEVTEDMGDAITVSRKLSRILNNSAKDPGVLTGRWSGSYADGTSPSSWRGSVQILKQYGRTKRPVKYAQCWVFSQVLTTVCRALGLPCRSLTNYESAHDTDKTVTIDSYKDENGEDLPDYKTDSIWNFHCWNDVWINRPDLDGSARVVSARGRYSGWHSIDATPQERSEGRYQCGPTPHKAVKNGELSVGFDTNFVFGEVNGEVCTWVVPKDKSHGLQLISRDPNAVGKNISTKTPDGLPARGTFNAGSRKVHEKRMDITDSYKFPEGSMEEREALKLAVGKGLGAKIFETPGGVSLDIIRIPDTMVGSNFTFKAVATNSGIEPRQINLTMGVYPIDYRGQRLGWDKVAFLKKEGLTLKPGRSETFELPVLEKSYLALCDKALSMMLRASAKVQGEEKPLSQIKKLVLSCPEISVEVPGGTDKLHRDQAFSVTLLVTNPCSRPLSNCQIQLSGTIQPLVTQGFTEVDGVFVRKMKDLFPRQSTTFNIDVRAQKQPLNNTLRELDVDLISNQLPNMVGSLDIKVI